MKINLPISGQERLFSADKTMVTKTDTKGVITFANKDFIEVSGYTEVELVGSSHNIIRHPDMPRIAFEQMWKTLKRASSWRGIVKNRCKNGDHYWVDAKIVPIKKSGQIIGYMSVRAKPSRAVIASVEGIYQLAIAAPEIIKEEIVPSWKKYLSIRNGIPAWILFVTLIMISGGILGISGLNLSKSAIHTLYYEELDAVQTIGRINFLMADNRAQVALALHGRSPVTAANPAVNPVASPATGQAQPASTNAAAGSPAAPMQKLLKNRDDVDRLWAAYSGQIHNEVEKNLADQYVLAHARYVQGGLLQAKQAFDNNDSVRAELILTSNVTPLFEEANARADALLKYLSERGKTKLAEATNRIWVIINVAIAGITLSCLVLIVAGIFFFSVTAKPLEQAVLALENIADGNLSGDIDTRGYGEPGRVMEAVNTTQMHLKVMMHEIRQSAESIHHQCHNLNQIMMNLAEHSEEQHDRVYQTVKGVDESRTDLNAIASSMERLMLTVEQAGQNGLAIGGGEVSQGAAFEPVATGWLDIFGDGNAQPEDPLGETFDAAGAEAAKETAGAAAAGDAGAEISAGPADGTSPAGSGDLKRQMNDIAGAARVQSLAVAEVATQLSQIAVLIVQNREDVQGAWAASQHLEQTAVELDKLVKYFE
ncbi:MAG: PAS domain-containing protein [Glaciimonas sp.]|nr:PAS domain-containing protein [Glaciimonas sp.]